MTNPFTDAPHVVNLQVLKVGVQERVSAQFAERMSVTQDRDRITDVLAMRVTATVLAEELPPVSVTERVAFTVPRFATWWDHFKATRWERWWVWILRDLQWIKPPRFVDEPHTHVADVKVRTYWTYPRANTVLPGRDFGHVVLKTQTSRYGREQPW
jgi:hypothetical protein